MVFNTLWTRISSLWSGSADESRASESASTPSEKTSEESDDETLSYAEEIEYGVDEHDLPDEDKILRLLVKRGGRVDQSTIREERVVDGSTRRRHRPDGGRRPGQRHHRRSQARDLPTRVRTERLSRSPQRITARSPVPSQTTAKFPPPKRRRRSPPPSRLSTRERRVRSTRVICSPSPSR